LATRPDQPPSEKGYVPPFTQTGRKSAKSHIRAFPHPDAEDAKRLASIPKRSMGTRWILRVLRGFLFAPFCSHSN